MAARAGRRWALCAGLVLSLAAGLLSAGPASAAVPAPTGLSPKNDAAASSSPTLSWSSVVSAVRYEVQVSATSAFASTLYTASTVNVRAVPTKALPSGPAFWRVRGISAANEASAWATESFTVTATAAPGLLSPGNGQTLVQPATPPLLSWSAVPGAMSYRVEVDTDNDFVGATAYTTKSTSFVVPDPKAGGDYWWRVQATLANGLNTAFSEERTYQISDLSSVVTTAPAENATVQDVVLTWNPVPGAKTYDLLVSSDADFNTIVDDPTGLKSTRYSPPITYLNNQYYWKVRPRTNLGETLDWAEVAIHTFRRNWPETPQLQYPANTFTPSVGGDLYFQWTPVPRATRYRLDVGTDPNFSPLTFDTCYTANTTYSSADLKPAGASDDLCLPGQGVPTYWRVMAVDDPADAPRGVQGIFSSIGKFIYDSGAVALTAPADGATVAVPTLSWQPVSNVQKYRVILTGGSGYRKQVDTYATSWAPTGTALDPAKSPYTWTVQSIAANGSLSPLRPGRTFTLAGSPATTAAAPLDPINGNGGPATTRFPNLTWEPMTGAATYRVKIGLAGTGFWLATTTSDILSATFPYPSATDTGKGILTPGDYDWAVTAYDKDGVLLGETSPATYGTFSIADLDAVGGQRIALSGTSLDANQACTARLAATPPQPTQCVDVPTTPVLDWDSVPWASHYMVYVAQDQELTNLVYTGVMTANSRWTPDWRDNPATLPDSQAGQAYYWYIRPCKAVAVCAPDPLSTDQAATHAFTKKSPAVELATPAEAAVVTTSQVPFTWTDYLTTNQATTFGYTTGGSDVSTQSGKQYRVQVSQSASFATLVDTVLVDQPTYTAFSATYPEGLLWWRVQVVDPDGNGLTWSPARKFTKSSPAPALSDPLKASPINGAMTNGAVPFRWPASDFAGSYQLEVYKNNDTNLSSVNRVVNYASKQTAYAPPTPLPVSTAKYLWRVARLDADGRPGQWSALQNFYSQGSQPSLLTPVPGEVVNGYSSYFTWSSVPGAVTYKFERKLVSATTVAETVTTAARAYAPTKSLVTGAWQWRVTALDAQSTVLGTTSWTGFAVDNTRGLFTPITPQRVLDTRTGLGASKRKVGPDTTITLTVPGLPASATAVALNVTATGPTASSYLTVFPFGQAAPTASNLNFVKGQTVPNMVTVAVGAGGKVSFKNKAGSVDVIADLAGYYSPVARSGFRAQAPVRVLDTRIGLGAPTAKLGAGGSVTLTIPGLPADATAVAMNVTATGPTASSYLTVYPNNATKPNASNLNYVAKQTVANMVVVAVGTGGKVKLTNAAGSVNVIADLAGYFQPDTGATFKAQSPKRILDTRTGLGAPKAKVGAGQKITITVPDLPAGTTAVVLNVTATGPTASSYATVFPGDQLQPTASNLNYLKGQTVPNMVTVSVGAGGKVSLANASGSVDFIADLAGAYIAP